MKAPTLPLGFWEASSIHTASSLGVVMAVCMALIPEKDEVTGVDDVSAGDVDPKAL